MTELRLSKKHGVNPSVDHCFICGKDYAVVLFGRMDKKEAPGAPGEKDIEAPRSCTTGGICDECQKAKDAGAIFLVEVDEDKTTDMQNPWRTGRIAGVTEEAVRRLFNPPDLVEQVVKKGLAFLPIDAYELLGLGEIGEKKLEE